MPGKFISQPINFFALASMYPFLSSILAPSCSNADKWKSTGLVPMAHPPGNAILANPYRATREPRTNIDARIVFTSSYRASKSCKLTVEILKSIFSFSVISAPIEPKISNIVVIS